MPPRPIHKSKTLWAGIITLTFLAWAWRDSTRFWTEISFRRYSLFHAGSGICLIKWGPTTGISPLRSSRSIITSMHHPWHQARLEAPATYHYLEDRVRTIDLLEDDPVYDKLRPRSSSARHFHDMIWMDPPGSFGIYIPHWLIILLFLIPWTALLLWRSHRIRHLTAGSAGRWPAEPPDSSHH